MKITTPPQSVLLLHRLLQLLANQSEAVEVFKVGLVEDQVEKLRRKLEQGGDFTMEQGGSINVERGGSTIV